ncbi:mercury(II) reductase [Pseudalkalibacillus sp. SCS-8]|uniref:mercury(II) reductase n=1 Tax=Pseudalkalibacillus nanhaiensis TaxID=3115291 RepID=UPI0032DB426B
MEKEKYDFVVIGSGAAAFSAAIQGVERGLKVAMIEKGTVGGTCVNVGCIPSKTMIRAAEINSLAIHQPFNGLTIKSEHPDLSNLNRQKNELVNRLRKEKYEDLIEEYDFDLIKGEAHFKDKYSISVGERILSAEHFLIATGATPFIPDIPGLKSIDFLTSTTALQLEKVPERIAVIGAGYIAMELGQLLHHLGAQVTLMQRSDRLVKHLDSEVSEVVEQSLSDQGMNLQLGITFTRVEEINGVKRIYFEKNGEEHYVEAEEILVAAGRKPNTTSLQLDQAGVETGEAGEVKINDDLQTNIPHIYAAGDVTLGPQYVYVAAYEGGLVAKNLGLPDKQKLNLSTVPSVIFTNPSIASVGLTEQEARTQGYEVQAVVIPLAAVPRALANHETTGLFKLVVDAQSKVLLGAQIVAENAGEVIYAATLAVKFQLTIDEIKDTMAPYLTMAEGIKLASLSLDRDVSKLSCCAE